MESEGIWERVSTAFDAAIAQPLQHFFSSVNPDYMYVFYALIVGAIGLGYTLGRSRIAQISRRRRYQNYSEEFVSRLISSEFGPPDYHLMNHVTLQMADGTTQIDHILISRFGIFVIETKHYKGWIFANPDSKVWTQVLYRRKFKFQNPILQNKRHIRAVRDLLDFLPVDAVKSVVIFTGEAEFKTKIPYGVFRSHEVVDYLRDQATERLSVDHVQLSVGRLESARLAISRETDVEHIQSLERRYFG